MARRAARTRRLRGLFRSNFMPALSRPVRPASSEPAPLPEYHFHGGDIRLLVIDDDYYTRHALRNLFARRGWRVEVASTIAEGMEALARARELQPDSVHVLCALAMAQLKHGETLAARQTVAEAERLDSGSADVQYCLHELAGA